MDFFNGKTAIVTGAGQGIGRGIAKGLNDAKAQVIAVDKNQEGLNSLEKECNGIEIKCVDLSDWDRTREVFEAIPRVDMLVNNAGVMRDAMFLEATKEDIDMVVKVNYLAPMNIMQIVGRKMKEQGTGGSIVNISSICSAKLEMDRKSIYGSTKAAIEKLTKSVAKELGQYKIRVNSVHPSLVDTPLTSHEIHDPNVVKFIEDRTANKRTMVVGDLIGPVMFLLNDNMSAMVQGESLHVDGGFN